MANKKILLIAYHFPPSSAVGGLRLASFAQYLPRHNLHTSVLTINENYLKNADKSRLAELSSITIHRSRLLPKISGLYVALKKYFFAPHLRTKTISTIELKSSGNISTGNEALFKKIKRYISSLFLTLPDRERNWVIPGTVRGFKIIKSEAIDCILTSCPPYSSHLIGLFLKAMTGVRWVADFRDPWSTGSQKRLYYTCALSKKIEARMEKQVLVKSDLILVNTRKLKIELQKTYPTLPQSKFLYVPNGFDQKLFSKISDVEKYPNFTISYLGGFYFGRTPEPLFRALQKLSTEKRIQLSEVSIRFYGNCDEIEGIPTHQLVGQYGLDGIVEVMPFIPYKEALKVVKKSHIVLLLAPDQPLQIPAKTYDYLGAGSRILALAREGATADLILETNSGIACDPSDIDGIKTFLVREISVMTQPEKTHPSALNVYERQVIIKNLANALHNMIST